MYEVPFLICHNPLKFRLDRDDDLFVVHLVEVVMTQIHILTFRLINVGYLWIGVGC